MKRLGAKTAYAMTTQPIARRIDPAAPGRIAFVYLHLHALEHKRGSADGGFYISFVLEEAASPSDYAGRNCTGYTATTI